MQTNLKLVFEDGEYWNAEGRGVGEERSAESKSKNKNWSHNEDKVARMRLDSSGAQPES